MTTLEFSSVGNRYYEDGLDRGVLYVEGADAGVVWPGLVSVTEKPTGGEVTSHYIDGVKYLDAPSISEFEATIEALSCPREFAECEGEGLLGALSFSNQTRKRFGLSYRSQINNDLEGDEFEYKIHILYNAIIDPISRKFKTRSESPGLESLSWDVKIKPPTYPSYLHQRPTAMLTINSLYATLTQLSAVEDILYGTVDTAPRLPTMTELVTIFTP